MKKILPIIVCFLILFTYVPAGLAAEPNTLPQTAAAYAASDYAHYNSRMAAGGAHIAVVKPDRTVAAWGNNDYGQLDIPLGLSGVKAVAAGIFHTLALKEDGTVVAWGKSYIDANSPDPIQIEIPAEVEAVQGSIKLIAAGGNMSAVVTTDNKVIAWGFTSYNSLTTLHEGLGNIVAMGISTNYAVVLNDAGNVTVWGYNTTVPTELSGNVVSVAAGTLHWLALKNDGKVTVAGSSTHVSKCVNISNQENVRAIGGGVQMAAALLDDGSVKCWGRTPSIFNTAGLELIPASSGIKALSSVVAPDDGNSSVCALQADGTLCVVAPPDSPQSQVPEGLNLIPILSGNANLSSLAVTGYGLTPTFDAATTSYRVNLPNEVTSVEVTAAIADAKSTLKIKDVAAVSGTGKTIDNLIVGDNPINIEVTAEDATLKTYTLNIKRADVAGSLPQTAAAYAASDYAYYNSRMAVGGAHIAVVKPDGTVAAWGNNDYGQLDIPQGLSGVKAVAAGISHTLALKEDSTVAAWGKSYIDAESEEPSPIEIPSEVQAVQGNIKLIAAGGNMSAVVTKDGGVIVWGFSSNNTAAVPAGLGNVVAMAISTNYAVALNDTGNVTVWGANTNVPAELNGNVVAVAAGSLHWLALKNDGKVTAAGSSTHVSKCVNISNQENVRAIGGGVQMAAALLEDGSVKGWGKTPTVYNTAGIELIPASANIKALSSAVAPTTGNSSICALKPDGTLSVLAPADSPQSQVPAGLNLMTILSDNANLTSLSVTGYDLTPTFDAATTSYTINLPNNVTSVEVTAAIADAKATLKIKDAAAASGTGKTINDLIVGDNLVAIEVTAEDATVKTYTINFKRSYEFNIGQVHLLNHLGQEITTVAGQSGYRVEAQIANMLENTTNGLVVIQIRNGEGATAENGGKVLNCIGLESSAIPVTGAAITSECTLPSGLSGTGYIDVFVWDGWDMQAPLSNPDHSRSFTVSN